MDIEEIKDFVYEVRTFGITSKDTKFVQITEYLLSELEKEKEKNKELSNSYDKLAKECNEENRRCMLLAVENQDLKEKNKALNLVRLQYLVSSFPDTTETYKKYKKELDELLKEE